MCIKTLHIANATLHMYECKTCDIAKHATLRNLHFVKSATSQNMHLKTRICCFVREGFRRRGWQMNVRSFWYKAPLWNDSGEEYQQASQEALGTRLSGRKTGCNFGFRGSNKDSHSPEMQEKRYQMKSLNKCTGNELQGRKEGFSRGKQEKNGLHKCKGRDIQGGEKQRKSAEV